MSPVLLCLIQRNVSILPQISVISVCRRIGSWKNVRNPLLLRFLTWVWTPTVVSNWVARFRLCSTGSLENVNCVVLRILRSYWSLKASRVRCRVTFKMHGNTEVHSHSGELRHWRKRVSEKTKRFIKTFFLNTDFFYKTNYIIIQFPSFILNRSLYCPGWKWKVKLQKKEPSSFFLWTMKAYLPCWYR